MHSLLARILTLLAFLLTAFLAIQLVLKVQNHFVQWLDISTDGNDSRPLPYHVCSRRELFMIAQNNGGDGGDDGDNGDLKTPLLLFMESQETVFSVFMRSFHFVPQQKLYFSAKQRQSLLREEDQYRGVSQVSLLSASIEIYKIS